MEELSNTDNNMIAATERSFFAFIYTTYELGPYIMPKRKPSNDFLSPEEREKILNLISERDYYEINSIIRNRYA